MAGMKFDELSVLVVEPSQAQYLVLNAMLGQLGVERIARAASGAEALAAMQGEPPHLVISTMHLPDMTGADLVLKMREDEALLLTPFMLVCSEESYKYLEPVRQAGAVSIIHKPASVELLSRGLHATLDLIAPDALDAEHPEIQGFHVLVVDDTHTSRIMIRDVLEKLGVESIDEAENGRQALELIDGEIYDLVITDYNMPEMDGEALTRYIREESNQSTVPILMVTSETNENRLAAIEQSGVSALCNKPFDPHVVRDILERVLVFGH